MLFVWGGGRISCGGFLLDFHKVGVHNEIDYREIINKSIKWGGFENKMEGYRWISTEA